MMPRKFVELNRTFTPVSSDSEDEAQTNMLVRGLLGSKPATWALVESASYVVILGDPGSGKTWEFRERVRLHNENGSKAFFIRIEDLAEFGLAHSLSEVEYEALIQLKANWKPAHFYLDSVDEARIGSAIAFQQALSNLAEFLGEYISITPIRVSCRRKEWRRKDDLLEFARLIQAHLPDVAEQHQDHHASGKGSDTKASDTAYKAQIEIKRAKNPSDVVKVWEITTLSQPQVRALAEGLNIRSAERFLLEIEKQDAWEFTTRPLDVMNLSEYWSQYNKLGQRLELTRFDVVTKLVETNIYHAKFRNLTPSLALSGAERLAAATFLCKKASILASTEIEGHENALDPFEILDDWDSRDIVTLLGLPLFDGISYGRVRFYHSAVVEYLAASWLDKLQPIVGIAQIQALLFKDIEGVLIPAGSLLPVIGWMGLINSDIKALAIKYAPDALLEFGDSRSLTTEDRKAVLRSFVELRRNRKWVRHAVYEQEIKRFAASDLTNEVLEYLDDQSLSSDLRELMIQIAGYGNITHAEPSLRGIVLDSTSEVDTKAASISSLIKLLPPQQIVEMVDTVLMNEAIPNRIAVTILLMAYPAFISMTQLVALVRQSEAPRHTYVGDLDYYLEKRIAPVVPVTDVFDLAHEFLKLLHTPPLDPQERISQRYGWLMKTVAILLRRGVESNQDLELKLPILIEFACLLDRAYSHAHDIRDEIFEIRRSINQSKSAKRGLFRNALAGLSQATFGFSSHELFEIHESDREWLVEELSISQTDIALKTIVHMLYGIALSDKKPARAIKQLALDLAGFGYGEYIEKLYRDRRIYRRRERLREKRQDAREAKELENKEASRISLLGVIDGIRAGTNFGGLFFLANAAKDRSRFSSIDWKDLELEYGLDLAQAAREGWKAYWPTYSPPLEAERGGGNSIENGVIVGLAGLGTAFRDQDDLAKLDEAKARIAARYAARELNGFPDFFESLTTAHAATVVNELWMQIEFEFNHQASETFYPSLLSKLGNAGSAVKQAFAPRILELLQSSEPKTWRVLDEAISVVLGSGEDPSHFLSSLARTRVSLYD